MIKNEVYLHLNQIFYATKYISDDLLVMELKKRELYMNKPIYLGQAILDISKTLMYEFWYDYIKPLYGDMVKLNYKDTDSFVMLVKTEDIYADISKDTEMIIYPYLLV